MHGLCEQARTIHLVVVVAVTCAGFPVEAIGEVATDTDVEVVGVFVIQGAGCFVAAQLLRSEDALQRHQVLQVGIPEVLGGCTGTGLVEAVARRRPELGTRAGLGLGGAE
ncbi:hypothetical protein G6F63_016229 [Rhizopus arrhizus]|nr:hypothetical protein G6F65_021359 [Rhizopus arrhizus]KAG1313121.1 hypothetical protein G6F63_016229 [Rhizopus arrhizus]KAG1385510.1 hypothetical protein G6F59_017361 [Rhizopus arrhizus]